MNPCLATRFCASRRSFTVALLGLTVAAIAVPVDAQCPPGPDRTCYTLRSGPGQEITATVGAPGVPLSGTVFGPADFAAAASGVPLVEVTPKPAPWLNPNSFSDPSAEWIGITSTGASGGFLLSHAFVLDGCAFDNACIEFHYAADDRLGDPINSGPNQIGVYLNGNPVPGFSGGGGFGAETTWSTAGIGGLLLPGCNRLEVYVRDTGYSISGVMYWARICFDEECLAKEYINLHTENGVGPTDSEIRALGVTPGVAITPLQFTAAKSAPFASFIAPFNGWCMNVGNPNAGWIGNSGLGTLYCHPFEITACNLTSLRFDARGAVYRFLGDAAGNPNVGVWINSHPILGSVADGNWGTACLSGSAVVGGCHLNTGTNYLFVYVRDEIGPIAPMTALIYNLNLTVTSCATPEQVHFASGPGVMQRSGPPASPLQGTTFVNPTDFVCGAPAAVVPAFPGWCPSISGSSAAWVSNNASRGPASILFCQTFQVNTCTGSIGKAILNLRHAVDDHLGDGVSGGPNIAGIYINGQAVYASGTTTGAAGICRTMTRNITSLVHGGTNTFSLYCRDTQAVVSGAMWDAMIDIDPCPRRGVIVGNGCFDRHATLDVRDDFVLGATGSFEIAVECPSALGAVLGLGFFNVPPIDLTMFGAPGCSVDIIPAETLFAPFFGPPVSFALAVPSDPSLIGVALFAQGFVLDPTVNALGLSVTEALRVTIEN